MVRFTENSIIIEIHTGNNPFEMLNYYQSNIIQALRHLNEDISTDKHSTINYYLGDILDNMLISAEQLTAIKESITNQTGDKKLIQQMQGNSIGG